MSIKKVLVPEIEAFEHSKPWAVRDRFFGRLAVTRSLKFAGAATVVAGTALALYGDHESASSLSEAGHLTMGVGAVTMSGGAATEAVVTAKHLKDIQIHIKLAEAFESNVLPQPAPDA